MSPPPFFFGKGYREDLDERLVAQGEVWERRLTAHFSLGTPAFMNLVWYLAIWTLSKFCGFEFSCKHYYIYLVPNKLGGDTEEDLSGCCFGLCAALFCIRE